MEKDSPKKKEILFSDNCEKAPDEQRAAFTEAARIEMFAEKETANLLEREPLSRLIMDGLAIGPLKIQKISEKQAKATASEGGFPLDDSELVTKDRKDVLLINGKKTKMGPALEIEEITKGQILLKTSKKWEPPKEPAFLIKNEGAFASAIFQRLSQPGSPWPPQDMGAIQKGIAPPKELLSHGKNFSECFDLCTGQNQLAGIKGPPGTGKTLLLAWAAACLADKGKSVLVVTNAHAACETAIEKIAEISRAFFPNLKIAKKTTKGGLPENLRNLEVAELESRDIKSSETFENYPIIGITTASLIKNHEMPVADFLFLDEAGQINAFAACAIASHGTNMVLFGDENQLPPVLQGEHHDHLDCAHSAMGFLRKRCPERTKTLLVNHRANAPSVEYTQKNHYPDIDLEAGKNKNAWVEPVRVTIKNKDHLLPSKGTHYIPISHQNRKKHAPEESLATCEIIKALLGKTIHLPDGERALETKDFVVLCPHKRQVESVRRALEYNFPNLGSLPDCGTVHKMQGQGRPVVIFCATASHTGYLETQAEFLFDSHLWNVATSRAIALTLILANKEAITKACPKTLAGLELKMKAEQGLTDPKNHEPEPTP